MSYQTLVENCVCCAYNINEDCPCPNMPQYMCLSLRDITHDECCELSTGCGAGDSYNAIWKNSNINTDYILVFSGYNFDEDACYYCYWGQFGDVEYHTTDCDNPVPDCDDAVFEQVGRIVIKLTVSFVATQVTVFFETEDGDVLDTVYTCSFSNPCDFEETCSNQPPVVCILEAGTLGICDDRGLIPTDQRVVAIDGTATISEGICVGGNNANRIIVPGFAGNNAAAGFLTQGLS